MSQFTGLGILIRSNLCRGRVRLPVWIGSNVGSFIAITASFPGIYRSEAERQARAQLMEHPVSTAFRGPGPGLDGSTIGALALGDVQGSSLLSFADRLVVAGMAGIRRRDLELA